MRHPIDLEALADLFTHRVAAVSDLVHIGLPVSLISSRCAPGGPWQHLIPGILLLGKAPPTRVQTIHAALRYAGPRAVLTGLDALQLHGIRAVPAQGQIHVLAPLPGSVSGCLRVHVERTARRPNPVLRNGFMTAPLARAAVDAIRRLRSVPEIRVILDEVAGLTGLSDLRAELAEAPRRGTATARRLLLDAAPPRPARLAVAQP